MQTCPAMLHPAAGMLARPAAALQAACWPAPTSHCPAWCTAVQKGAVLNCTSPAPCSSEDTLGARPGCHAPDWCIHVGMHPTQQMRALVQACAWNDRGAECTDEQLHRLHRLPTTLAPTAGRPYLAVNTIKLETGASPPISLHNQAPGRESYLTAGHDSCRQACHQHPTRQLLR